MVITVHEYTLQTIPASLDMQRRNEYLLRPFVGWDGEGVTVDGRHKYTLLATSQARKVYDSDGIPTQNALEFMLNTPGEGINVVFSGNYDVNMILKDLTRPYLEQLYETGQVRWRGYFLDWKPSKSFRVSTRERSFMLYDVWPFFQCSFVHACDQYFGPDWEGRELVVSGKAERHGFADEDHERVEEYNRAELAALVRLAWTLRKRLDQVGIRIQRWDGPGAVAAAIYKKHKIKSAFGTVPDPAARAGRYACAAGRFETIRNGVSNRRHAYQYDIRSAYPAAMRTLPCLACGEWQHRMAPGRVGAGLGLYRVEVVEPLTESFTQPQPLWMRNKDGTIYYTEWPHNWYHTPEATLAVEMSARRGKVVVHESWEYQTECGHEPFAFVQALYDERAALKASGDGAHIALKLGLNSLYGKLAQQLGWEAGPPLRIPPYHCLEWAGHITSHCRASVYRAALLALDDVIAFETDAVFSRARLPVDIGTGLGQWDETEYTSLTYLKSGMYYGTTIDGTEVEKSRGIDKGSLSRTTVENGLTKSLFVSEPLTLPAVQTRFVTLGQALHQNFDQWRQWIVAPKAITVNMSGKRINLLDREDERAMCSDGWQETQPGHTETEFSYPFPVEWIDGPTETPDDHRRLDAHELREE